MSMWCYLCPTDYVLDCWHENSHPFSVIWLDVMTFAWFCVFSLFCAQFPFSVIYSFSMPNLAHKHTSYLWVISLVCLTIKHTDYSLIFHLVVFLLAPLPPLCFSTASLMLCLLSSAMLIGSVTNFRASAVRALPGFNLGLKWRAAGSYLYPLFTGWADGFPVAVKALKSLIICSQQHWRRP